MAHYNFRRDLLDAKSFEDEVEKELISLGCKVERCNNGDYDILAERSDGKTFTYECKDDLMADRTGNLAIEFESRGKPSGISTTKADYYKIRVGKKKVYTFKTQYLKDMITKKLYHRIVNGGDRGSNTMMYLFKIETLEKDNTK